jgi:aerobic C4-dicarboxylate transport protein
MKKIFTNLTFWVLTAITAGAILGYLSPGTAIKMELLGKGFIKVVTVFIYPIIFLTITLGISGMTNLKKAGKVGGKAIIYFEIVTTFALIIGVIVVHFIKPGSHVITGEIQGGDITQYVKKAQTFSWWTFLKDNITIQVLILAILSGIFLSKYKNREKIIAPLTVMSKYVFKALHFVMLFAPIGAFGGMAYTIGKYGLHTLLPLGKLMLTVYITMALFIFIVLNLILRYYKIKLLYFLKYINA